MLMLTRAVRVFAYAAPVDMRKGFDGLGALVEQQLGGQLLKGDVFLFVGRCRRRAKVLYSNCQKRWNTPASSHSRKRR